MSDILYSREALAGHRPERLRDATVLVVGAGATGSNLLQTLRSDVEELWAELPESLIGRFVLVHHPYGCTIGALRRIDEAHPDFDFQVDTDIDQEGAVAFRREEVESVRKDDRSGYWNIFLFRYGRSRYAR